MATRDAMQFVNEQDEATLERFFIERLEFRGTDPTSVGYREACLELVELTGPCSTSDAAPAWWRVPSRAAMDSTGA